MKNNFTCKLCKIVLALILLFGSNRSLADRITGAGLSYAYVSGSTYKIKLTVYGDCGPTSGLPFNTLSYASPQVLIYNGGTYIDSIHLVVQPPDSGVDITLLCPGDTSNCTNLTSTIRGIKKFVYSAEYTLPSASAAWCFIFNGYMGTAAAAGREAAITNLNNPGTTLIQLEDTINNTVYNSSAPTINSIPDGFVLDVYNEYNPMAVDSAGDALNFILSQPMNGTETSTIGTAVGYMPGLAWVGQPLTATTPLQNVSPPPAYNFDPASGKLVFYTEVLQRSTIVYNIEAYRAGTLVGTSQMEMNIGVISGTSPYVNAPYVGPAIYSPSCGTAPDTVSVSGVAISCGISGVQWQSSPDNTTWTNIAGATSDMYAYTSTTSMYFRCFQVNTILGDTAYGTSVYAPASAANLFHWSVVNIADTLCESTVFYVSVCDTSSFDTVTTYFGDGTSSVTPAPMVGGLCSANISHWYTSPGTFLVKEVLSNGGVAVDSGSYPYSYFYCRTLQARFYYDSDSDCVYNDTFDFLNYYPLTVEIDSNGVPVDTMSVTSGLYYTAYGGSGTIYSFKVLSTIYGLYVSCPSSGILSDTISSSVSTYPIRYFALRATPGTTGFDLVNNTTVNCSILAACGSILISNTYPIPVPAVVTMSFSPKYFFDYSSPAAASVVGNTVTWNLGLQSSSVPPTLISFHLADSGGVAIPFGDTIHINSAVTPVTGDINPANNTCAMVDTVLSAYDPNYIAVAPQGYITSGTQLQYTIHFENTGNDTAFNIFVMDTLSQYVNPHTFSLIGASAPMNIWSTPYGTGEIIKFDFPNINLLDSSHHGQCDGMLVFNINAKIGLPNGTIIPNHAGVFFNYNPAVLTNTVHNIIGIDTTTKAPVIINGHSITIFPNPTTTELTIQMSPNAYISFTITNSIGQNMIAQTLNTPQTQVNVAALRPGLYYITFRGDNGTSVQKFVKM